MESLHKQSITMSHFSAHAKQELSQLRAFPKSQSTIHKHHNNAHDGGRKIFYFIFIVVQHGNREGKKATNGSRNNAVLTQDAAVNTWWSVTTDCTAIFL